MLAFVEKTKPKVFVIGTGGSGTNTLNRLFELNVKDVQLVAMNTDARHLLKIRAHRKLLLGKTTTRGHGAGSNPQLGEAAAKESADEIKNLIAGANMVFITCGLGGGTGGTASAGRGNGADGLSGTFPALTLAQGDGLAGAGAADGLP
ncbi:MAG: hypothetical protein ACK4JE_03180, partial [Endomicrobiia bacterium]